MQIRPLQRSIACAVLLSYMAGGTPVIPTLAAVAAGMDGSHAVMLAETESGTCLVLHHQPGCCTPRVKDHANPLTRVLVALSRLDSHRDHQFTAAHFSSGSVPLRDDLTNESRNTANATTQPPPLLLTAVLWNAREVSRVPVPPDEGADDALRRQSRRALASVQLLV